MKQFPSRAVGVDGVRAGVTPQVGAWSDDDGVGSGVEGDAGYDALAELFLGDGGTDAERDAGRVAPGRGVTPSVLPGAGSGAPTAVRSTGVRVQAVVLGHVPTLGAAWLKQTARTLSESMGRPIGVLRLIGGEGTLEVVGGSAALRPGRDLVEAFARALPELGGVMIRVEDRHEAALVGGDGVDEIVMLTTADEAGIVGAYRTLKGLVPQHGAGAALPAVKLAIVGSLEERAGPAAERLSKAAQTFLSKPVEVLAAIPRIHATPGQPPAVLFHGPVADAGVVLGQVLGVIEGHRDRGDADMTPQSAVVDVPAAIESSVTHVQPEMPYVATSSSASEPVRATASAGRAPGVPAGVIGLGRLCPVAPDVEIGIDRSGGVHVCVPCEHGQAMHAACGQLSVAAAWASEQQLVLAALAEREAAGLDRSRAVTAHLMLRDPKAVRMALACGVCVHLVTPLASEAPQAWSVSTLA